MARAGRPRSNPKSHIGQDDEPPEASGVTGGGDTTFTYSVVVDGRMVNALVTIVGPTRVTVSSTATVDQAEARTRQVFTRFATATTRTAPSAPSVTGVGAGRGPGPGRDARGPRRAIDGALSLHTRRKDPEPGRPQLGGQPPEMSWTFCLPAVTKGIMSRSSAPTVSIWWS